VAKAGKRVKRFREGDRVTVAHHVPCNACRYCLAGQYSLCDTLRTTTFDPGGFCEYVRVPAVNVDRGTFLIDPHGVVQFSEVTAEGIGRNAAELVRKIKAALYVRSHPGEVCPAKWEEGEDTLAPSLDLVGKI